jgi:hypothetical protein
MTEWRSPADADGPGDDQPDEAGRRPERSAHRRQNQVLIVAGALIAAAVVLLLVVLLGGGDDGPAKGSPEAVTDQFAGALRSGQDARITAVSCASARAAVLTGARPVLGRVTSAHRSGGAAVSAEVAVARLALSVGGKHEVGTLALRKQPGTWCVAGFVASAAP